MKPPAGQPQPGLARTLDSGPWEGGLTQPNADTNYGTSRSWNIAPEDSHGRAIASPILLVPYVWIGDFVRCHTVVRVLKERWPDRPIDVLTSSLCAPLADYMPGVRKAIVLRPAAQPHRDGPAARAGRAGCAARVTATRLIMPRTWKSALAPARRHPRRTGFVGEARFGLFNDWRWGEKALPRMVDRCAALALPAGHVARRLAGAAARVAGRSRRAWRQGPRSRRRPAVALAPGAVGPSKRWSYFGEAAQGAGRSRLRCLGAGRPGRDQRLAAEIVAAIGPRVRDLTSNDLRNAILALANALCQ